MIRGSSPTFSFLLPSCAGDFSEINIVFMQRELTVLDFPKSKLTLDGNTVSLTMTEQESLSFEDGIPAEVQIRLVTEDRTVLLSEIRRIHVGRRFPDLQK